MANGLLMVRSKQRNTADCAALDRWCEREHLPDAKHAFGAEFA